MFTTTTILTLISGLIGFLASTVPRYIAYLEKKKDQEHEREILKLQTELVSKGHSSGQIIAAIEAAKTDRQSAREHDSAISGSVWVNDFRALIRPSVTLIFTAFFILVKTTIVAVMIWKGFEPFKIVEIVWDEWTIVTFGLILSYWFGGREYFRQQEANKK
jgi:nucleoside recognition membrane protein YjiH